MWHRRPAVWLCALGVSLQAGAAVRLMGHGGCRRDDEAQLGTETPPSAAVLSPL